MIPCLSCCLVLWWVSFTEAVRQMCKYLSCNKAELKCMRLVEVWDRQIVDRKKIACVQNYNTHVHTHTHTPTHIHMHTHPQNNLLKEPFYKTLWYSGITSHPKHFHLHALPLFSTMYYICIYMYISVLKVYMHNFPWHFFCLKLHYISSYSRFSTDISTSSSSNS